MAEAPKKKRQLRKVETVREKAEKPAKAPKVRRLHSAKERLGKPLGKAAAVGRKEYYLPLPENKVGRFLNKKRSLIPAYFRNSFAELKQVDWPGFGTIMRLSLAVFLFAFFFGLVVAIADFGLDKLFKELIIK